MSRAHARPQHAKRRMAWIGVISAAALTGLAVAALAATGGDEPAAQQAIACPSPLGALPEVPAAAQAEVARELANLDKQIAEANARLAGSAGEGGPNFVQNAILGPLADKRTAALDRIAIAIGRTGARPPVLQQFATCQLGAAGQQPPAPPAGTTTPAQAAGQIVCPDPVIGDVPAAAQAEVTRELANLDKQIAEANARLANSVGQGGANFVQNAILGPLADKRTAALDRIAIAIGRVAERPQNLQQFATCEVGQGAAEPGAPATGAPAPGTSAPGTPANEAPAAGRIACPTPVIPNVPAAAQAEVTRELANLDKQIAEANARLVSSAGEGGANFVQNAILGPLADKRTAALNRIETAIGRVAAKPEGLEQFATCGLA